MSFHVPEIYRYMGDAGFNEGAFRIQTPYRDGEVFVVASDGLGWEHVSVSLKKNRCPSWETMCFIKSIFWDEEDCVVQYHPPKSQYVNNHPGCLHLWRPTDVEIPVPPTILVGVK